MATMNRELYEALREANVSDEKALKAAAVVATVADAPRRLERIETAVADLKTRVAVLQWMIGLNLATSVAVLWR